VVAGVAVVVMLILRRPSRSVPEAGGRAS